MHQTPLNLEMDLSSWLEWKSPFVNMGQAFFFSQEEHIKNVTKEFCDWVASLGGDSNNIEESTITSLFASGYETKPALSVPIHVVELTNVPPELRMSATVPQQQQQSKNLPQEEKEKTKWVCTVKILKNWTPVKLL